MGLFIGISVQDKLHLMDYLNPITFMPGQVISKQDTRVPDLFIFTSGTIRIYRDDILLCKQIVTKSFYDGDRELFFNEPRSRTLVAETFVDGWRLKRHHFSRLMHNNRSLRNLVIANAGVKFSTEFGLWSKRIGFVSGNLMSVMRTREIYPADEFPDIEKGMESREIDPGSYL
jgi:signal-transduction protein with cAMP-binding, CBS, and nucleotidyltransferase domain